MIRFVDKRSALARVNQRWYQGVTEVNTPDLDPFGWVCEGTCLSFRFGIASEFLVMHIQRNLLFDVACWFG